MKLQLQLETAASGLKLNIDDAAFSVDNLALVGGAMTPLKLGRLGFEDGALDLAARRVSLGRLYADGGLLDLSRDRAGRFLFLDRLPGSGAVAATPAASSAPVKSGEAAWDASVKTVELSKFCLLYTSPSPRDATLSRMPSSA